LLTRFSDEAARQYLTEVSFKEGSGGNPFKMLEDCIQKSGCKNSGTSGKQQRRSLKKPKPCVTTHRASSFSSTINSLSKRKSGFTSSEL